DLRTTLEVLDNAPVESAQGPILLPASRVVEQATVKDEPAPMLPPLLRISTTRISEAPYLHVKPPLRRPRGIFRFEISHCAPHLRWCERIFFRVVPGTEPFEYRCELRKLQRQTLLDESRDVGNGKGDRGDEVFLPLIEPPVTVGPHGLEGADQNENREAPSKGVVIDIGQLRC